jgi:hypothetical protein
MLAEYNLKLFESEWIKAHETLVRKPDGNRSKGEGLWMSADWIHLDQNTIRWEGLVSTVMYLWVPQSVENFLSISCSRKIQQL